MQSIATIERAINSDVLIRDLTFVPDEGASDMELEKLGSILPRSLSFAHIQLLKRWNGANLEVIRIFGAACLLGGPRTLDQIDHPFDPAFGNAIIFGDDPSGFLYLEGENGEIYSLDHDGGRATAIARNLDEFFSVNVFGAGAAQFAGEDWKKSLERAGLI
jgi:hypothetical protein